jgi:antitoxin component YwqK of YwqJK toxin-antitoxin module
LKVYDEKENLMWEAIQYTDCKAGFYIDYYPNGQIRSVGQFKENKTDT